MGKSCSTKVYSVFLCVSAGTLQSKSVRVILYPRKQTLVSPSVELFKLALLAPYLYLRNDRHHHVSYLRVATIALSGP